MVQLFNVDDCGMKVGALYRLAGLTYANLPPEGSLWLYLGPESLHRDDGVTIVNHRFLVEGVRRLADVTFLRFLYPIETKTDRICP